MYFRLKFARKPSLRSLFFRMSLLSSCFAFLYSTAPLAEYASPSVINPDALITCVEINSDLEPVFKDRILRGCFQIAYDICEAQEGPQRCLNRITDALIVRIDEIRETLPAKIEGSPIRRSHYSRTLNRIDENLESKTCIQDRYSNGEFCRYLKESLRLTDAYRLQKMSENNKR